MCAVQLQINLILEHMYKLMKITPMAWNPGHVVPSALAALAMNKVDTISCLLQLDADLFTTNQ
jgi:hypothetical protein